MNRARERGDKQFLSSRHSHTSRLPHFPFARRHFPEWELWEEWERWDGGAQSGYRPFVVLSAPVVGDANTSEAVPASPGQRGFSLGRLAGKARRHVIEDRFNLIAIVVYRTARLTGAQ